MWVATAIVVLGLAGFLAGCGMSDSDQVRAKIEQFARAAAAKDYATICNQVLAPTLVQRLSSAGVSCEQAMQIALRSVQEPTLSIGRIKINGHTASAIALSTAKGQTASLDAIDLVKTDHGWRLASLASPLSAGSAK